MLVADDICLLACLPAPRGVVAAMASARQQSLEGRHRRHIRLRQPACVSEGAHPHSMAAIRCLGRGILPEDFHHLVQENTRAWLPHTVPLHDAQAQELLWPPRTQLAGLAVSPVLHAVARRLLRNHICGYVGDVAIVLAQHHFHCCDDLYERLEWWQLLFRGLRSKIC